MTLDDEPPKISLITGRQLAEGYATPQIPDGVPNHRFEILERIPGEGFVVVNPAWLVWRARRDDPRQQ